MCSCLKEPMSIARWSKRAGVSGSRVATKSTTIRAWAVGGS